MYKKHKGSRTECAALGVSGDSTNIARSFRGFSKTCGQHYQAIACDSSALRKSYPTFLFLQLSIAKELIYSDSINMVHDRKTLE